MRNDNKNRFSFEAIKNSALAFALVSATCVPAVAFATTQQANIAVDQSTSTRSRASAMPRSRS